MEIFTQSCKGMWDPSKRQVPYEGLRSVVGRRNALDVLNSGNGGQSVLEVGSDGLDGVVDGETGVYFHECEGYGLDLGLEEFHALGKYLGDGLDDRVEVDVRALGQDVVRGNDLSHSHTSRSAEPAVGAFVGDALIAALLASSDLDFPALGALEEGVAVADKSLPAGGANLVCCHSRTDNPAYIKK